MAPITSTVTFRPMMMMMMMMMMINVYWTHMFICSPEFSVYGLAQTAYAV